MTRLMSLALMRTPIYVALLVTVWRWRLDGASRPLLSWLLVLIVPVFFVVNFPGALSRTWMGTIVISLIVVYFLTLRRPRVSLFPLFLLGALLTIYPIAHYFRSAAVGFKSSIGQSILGTYSAGSFDVFAMVAHYVSVL
jgi:hypothetical protein